MSTPTIWWIRSDLRLTDNAALTAAMRRGNAVVPVFVWSGSPASSEGPGEASRCWLAASLAALGQDLLAAGSRLVIRRGDPLTELRQAAAECGAGAVMWNRRYEPSHVREDTLVKEALVNLGFTVNSFHGSVLLEPFEIANKSGRPFRVFTSFWRHCQTLHRPRELFSRPDVIPAPENWPGSAKLSELKLASPLAWSRRMLSYWQPGERGAQLALQAFVEESAEHYAEGRDRPDEDRVSRLSPALAFGELHPEQILSALASHSGEGPAAFVRQLYWRDFARHLLFHFPHSQTTAMNPRFSAFPWADDTREAEYWRRGLTGYPLIDAGLRELWTTGWMHNRVRMNAASFLVKHLLVSWRTGAAWFWNTLVDADLANNTMGWQWVAGCGADAAPYFRIFNPVIQGQRFDPAGTYVRRWVPELGRLDHRHIHRPWMASPIELQQAGVRLGRDYPHPIIGHRQGRERALAALKHLPRT